MQNFARLLLIMIAGCLGGLAQYTSQQISGFVKDSSGSVVASAKVTATQVSTGFTRNVTSAPDGSYVFNNTPIGDYEVQAEAPGFKRLKQSGVTVSVNAKVALDLTLEVGSVSDSITVATDAVSVEASSGEIGRLVTGEQATKLQLNGRNFAQLLALLPGVSTTNRSAFDLFGGFGSNMSAQSVNGGRTSSLSWNIDGADNKDNGGGGNNFVNINPDAIAEFKVLTSNYSAEYGQNAGAVVNIALKSGTKNFHGGLYHFIRNDAFDARAFNATRKQQLRFNNFGGNFSGPVLLPGSYNRTRDKLFFFAGTEFKRLRRGNPVVWNVPVLAERAGDFSARPAAQQPRDVANGNVPFPGGVIPPSRFAPNGKRMVDLYPAPNFTGSGGNFAFQPADPLDADQYIFKIDWLLSEKNQISFHHLTDLYNTVINNNQFARFTREIPGQNTSLKWTMVPSPTTVNTLQFSVTGNVIRQGNFEANPLFIKDFSRQANNINYPTVYGRTSAIPQFNVSGFNAIPVNPQIWNNFNRIFQFKNDWAKVIGSHNLKIGALVMRSRKNQDNQPQLNGAFTFSPGHPLHSTNPLADALLGNFNTYIEASSGREGWFRFTQAEFYITDNWKVNRRLTLDYGVRYQLMQPQYAALRNASVFAPRFFDARAVPEISRSNGQITPGTGNPVNGLAVGDTAFPSWAAERIPNANDREVQGLFRGLPKEISPYDFGTLGPRLGFALDVTGKQQTVVRGGYGMFFERVQGNFLFGRVNNPPFVQEANIFSANIENPAGGAQRQFPSNVSSYEIDLKVPTVQNWSLGVQHKLGAALLLDVAYVGSNAWHQYRARDLNQLPTGTLQANPGVNANALRPFPGYATITQFDTGANFNYHSLQSQLRKQWSRGGSVSVSYTWAKSIGDNSGFNEVPMDSYNARRDRSRTTYDRRHVFVASYIYPLPFWQTQDAWYKVAFGGWSLSGVTTMQTGLPLNPTIQGDRAGTATGGQRPDLVGDPYQGAGTRTNWINAAAFANPALGSFGNLGRNALDGPGTNNWDVSVQKQFSIRERVKLDFRAEMYNAPHHFSYFGVATTLGAANFGQVTSANDPRTLQFGLKLAF
jgi:hypothetical protein